MSTENNLKYLGALTLIYEYRQTVAKIATYEDKIQECRTNKDKDGMKRYQAPLKLYETYKLQLEAEADRRNMPVTELTGITE